MSTLSLGIIKARLDEAAKAPNPLHQGETKPKAKTKTTATEPSSKADKMKPGKKGEGAPKLKKLEVKRSPGVKAPEAPAAGKLSPHGNGGPDPKKVSEPKLAAGSSKGSSKTPLASASGSSLDLSKLGIKWAKTRELSQTEKTDLEGTGIMSKNLKKISFSMSMPKIDFGIVPHDSKVIPNSQSPKFHEVGKVKLVKEGLINGQVVIRLPNNVLSFDVMTTKELKSICENYNNIGQEIEVVFKPMVRKFYLRSDIKKALAEAVHYNANNLKTTYLEKLSEGKKAVKSALVESHSDYFQSEKNAFVSETFKAVIKEGYNFYKALYESQLKPYDVTVRAYTTSGKERFKIVTRALSEGHAAYNAFSEVLSETGVATKFDSAFVGAKKFTFEEVQGILSKSLKFDIPTKDFAKAGPQTAKTGKNTEVKAPSVPKTMSPSNKKIKDVTAMPKLPKGGNKDAKADMGKDKRSKTPATSVDRKPAKDAGIKWPK